jgi:Leucine-rich repeat
MPVESQPHKEIVGGGADAKYVQGAAPALRHRLSQSVSGSPATLFHFEEDPVGVAIDAGPEVIPGACACAGCTELYLGAHGIEHICGFERFVNLECLWLNGNRLRAVANLDANFRIRELYLQDNAICTLRGSLRCFKFLNTLELSNNQLGNLSAVVDDLKAFNFLESLNLLGNPCCQEAGYRAKLIRAIPSLAVLDLHAITATERKQAQVSLCPDQRIRRSMLAK